jgi:hypothetical protein
MFDDNRQDVLTNDGDSGGTPRSDHGGGHIAQSGAGGGLSPKESGGRSSTGGETRESPGSGTSGRASGADVDDEGAEEGYPLKGIAPEDIPKK